MPQWQRQKSTACRHSNRASSERGRCRRCATLAVRRSAYLEWFAMIPFQLVMYKEYCVGMKMERMAFSHCHVSALA